MIINIGLIRYILNSKFKVISINFWNSKYKIISIFLITRIHEQHDYKYWSNKIYFEFKI